MGTMINTTIETGIRLNAAQLDELDIQNLVKTTECNHIQIDTSNLNQLITSSSFLRKELGNNYELSFRINGNALLNGLTLELRTLFEISKEQRAKYIIIQSNQKGYKVQEFLKQINAENIIRLAERFSTFLCLEVNLDSVIEGNEADSWTEISALYSSNFFLLSLHLNNLSNAHNLKFFSRNYRNRLGIVSAKIDLLASDLNNKFTYLIDHLYWLPFKQQPLIFTNPYNEIKRVFLLFNEIIRDKGYYYL